MFITDSFVFIELPKTGTTFIIKFLPLAFPGIHTSKHAPATPELLASKRKFLGSIRNPWDWYTSMWAFGCLQKGVIYRTVTGPGSKNKEEWLDAYKDINDPARFRKWIKMIHTPKYMRDTKKPGKKTIDTHGWHKYDNEIGLYSSCYLRIFTPPHLFKEAINCSTPEQAKDFDQKNCYISYFIKTENLEENLLHGLEYIGAPLNPEHAEMLSGKKQRNTTPRRDTSFYYDHETATQVAKLDKFIIEKFEYPALITS